MLQVHSKLARVGWFALLLVAGPSLLAETGTVTAVVDGDTLEVRTPTRSLRVRLIGIDTPERARRGAPIEPYADESTAFTRQRALSREVRLERDPQGDSRDAFGRALRYVYLPDGRLLNADILASGHGQAFTRFPFGKLDEFRRLEREARAAGRGLWAPDRVPVLDVKEASRHIGVTATVCGRVASTRFAKATRGAPTFLNLERPHPDQELTIVIWGTDRGGFGRPEEAYSRKRLCVTGKIEEHQGKPEIGARDPTQIAVSPPPE